MKFHEISMVGKYYVEYLESVPTWTPTDETRLIYVNENLYYADDEKWIKLSLLDELNTHINDLDNPHLVTTDQISAATKTELNTHINDLDNPHLVTTDQISAATKTELNTHINDTVHNPVGSIILFAGSTPPDGYFECNGSLKSISEYNDLYNVIGSIYGSGGTGTFVLPDLRGKFIRGYDNGRGIDTGRTFGSSQESQNKSHNHSTSGSLSSAGDHYHSWRGTVSNNPGHSHSITGSTSYIGNHVHKVYTSNSNDNHAHNRVPAGSSYVQTPVDDPAQQESARGAGAHSHSVSGYTLSGGSHSHTVAGVMANNGSHTHSFSGSSSSEGGGESRPTNVALMYCIKY